MRTMGISFALLALVACAAPPAGPAGEKVEAKGLDAPAADWGDSPGCSNTCPYAGDGECDDGGPASDYAVCTLGSDCDDCGWRPVADAPPDVELEPWARELADHVAFSARYHAYGEALVAGGVGAPTPGCVGAWAVGGAAIGDIASKGCWGVGLVASETGVGLAVAGVCGLADVTQIDALLGAVAGAVSGLVACSFGTTMPTDTASDWRFVDAESGRSESLSDVGRRLRSESCPADDAVEADADCWMYFHYTSAAGFGEISAGGVIRANARNQVFVTWVPYSPSDAETSLFIGSPAYEGRADYVVVFRKADPGVRFEPGTQWNELVHYGSLRLGSHVEPLYVGPNPF
jgi:hypothetical protein